MKKFYKFLDKVGAALLGLFFATFIVWFTGAVIFVMWDTGLLKEIAYYFAGVAIFVIPFGLTCGVFEGMD